MKRAPRVSHLVAATLVVCRFPFPAEVIMAAVRCDLRYWLSYRDVEDFSPSGIEIDQRRQRGAGAVARAATARRPRRTDRAPA